MMGRKAIQIDGAGTNEWVYDTANHVVTNRQSRAASTLVYTYDIEGNRSSMSVNGALTTYGYDGDGRMTSVSNAIGMFEYTWHTSASLIQSVTYPNGASVSNRYDVLGRLLDKQNLNSTGGVVSRFSYDYNNVGLRTNLTLADGSHRAFGYDTIRQLTDAQGFLSGGGSDTNYQFSYGYDTIGNYTQAIRQSATEVYRANSLNQYTNTTGYAMVTYDANGNMMNDGLMQYGWDEENRLVTVTNGDLRTECVYNGWGWRVERREFSNGVPTETVRYVYDDVMPVVELDGSNNVLRTITRGLSMSHGLKSTGGIGNLLALIAHAGTTNSYWYFFDGNGNVVDLIDAANVSAAHYEYDPFGRKFLSTGALADQPYQWSSKEHDQGSGLNYYGFRFHCAQLGRWLNRDPIGERGGLNLYRSARNNAILRFDPLGLKCRIEIHAGHTDENREEVDDMTNRLHPEDCEAAGLVGCFPGTTNPGLSQPGLEIPGFADGLDEFLSEHDTLSCKNMRAALMKAIEMAKAHAKSTFCAGSDHNSDDASGGCCDKVTIDVNCSRERRHTMGPDGRLRPMPSAYECAGGSDICKSKKYNCNEL